MERLYRWLLSQGDTDAGAVAAEYAILAALIAAVVAGVVGLIGQRTAGLFAGALAAFH